MRWYDGAGLGCAVLGARTRVDLARLRSTTVVPGPIDSRLEGMYVHP